MQVKNRYNNTIIGEFNIAPKADLRRADLRGADLREADLLEANLRWADLHGADLRGANLYGADLHGADLSGAYLREANLRGANLSGAYLSGAYLSGADLSWADLSGAKGLINPTEWLISNFEQDGLGIIVYKVIGDTHYSIPNYWKIQHGEFLEEVVNPLPTVECGCGVNFSTRDWINNEFDMGFVTIWKCRIRWVDLATVVVPYNTDGKARCGKLELLENV